MLEKSVNIIDISCDVKTVKVYYRANIISEINTVNNIEAIRYVGYKIMTNSNYDTLYFHSSEGFKKQSPIPYKLKYYGR
jgi:hypothetical protein